MLRDREAIAFEPSHPLGHGDLAQFRTRHFRPHLVFGQARQRGEDGYRAVSLVALVKTLRLWQFPHAVVGTFPRRTRRAAVQRLGLFSRGKQASACLTGVSRRINRSAAAAPVSTPNELATRPG
jgi:hypothetical protein